jgi:CRP-like cAMP-binding protein
MLTVEDAFRATPCVNEFPSEVVKAISPFTVVERHSAGSVIFREGIVHDQFAIVISGSIALEMHIPGRGDLRILTVGHGDVLGWSPLLSRRDVRNGCHG